MVVLPLVPVTATNGLSGRQRQAISSSPVTSIRRATASAITGACQGTPGLLTTVRARSKRSTPSTPTCTSKPGSPSMSGRPESSPITSPWGASISRRGQAGALEADDEVGPGRQVGPPAGHLSDAW